MGEIIMFKTKSVQANILTAYCDTCKTEREFYSFRYLKVCTSCLRSEIIQKKTGNQKELSV